MASPRSLAPDEQTPLLSEGAVSFNNADESDEPGERYGLIESKGSVYTYMLLMPPLSRKMHGHYCTNPVLLGFSLFCLSILLQTSLTFLAGEHVFKERKLWKEGLVQDKLSDNRWELKKVQKFADDMAAARTAAQFGRAEKIQDLIIDKPGETCCSSTSCFGYGIRCCARKNTIEANEGSNSGDHLAFLRHLLQKPGGSGSGSGSSGGGHSNAKKDDDKKGKKDGDQAWPPRPASLCYSSPGNLDCEPPSARVLTLWDKLDEDGDGEWTIEEARRDTFNVGCHAGVAPEDILQSACRGIMRDVADSNENGQNAASVPEVVRTRKALPKPYFEYWAGIAALCINTDVSRCGSMVGRGMFDGALDPKNNFTRGGVVDLDSAMSYCSRLLSTGGICDAALPGAYVLYRSRIAEKCGSASYSTGPRYTNPHNSHDVISITTVNYANLTVVRLIHSTPFLFFLFLVIVLWYVNLVDELRDIIDLWDFIAHFPVDNEMPLLTAGMKSKLKSVQQQASAKLDSVKRNVSEVLEKGMQKLRTTRSGALDDPASSSAAAATEEGRLSAIDVEDTGQVEEEEEGTITPRTAWSRIDSIARPHQFVCLGIATVRSIVLVYLAIAGTEFMLMNHSYVDLLLNSLAIAFIFDLDEFLYIFLVPEKVKDMLEDEHAKMKFQSSVPTKGWPRLLFVKHVWGLCIIPILAGVYVLHHDWHDTAPVLEALECGCLQRGPRCNKNVPTDVSWWNDYWKATARLAS